MWRSHAKRPFLDYKTSLKREMTFNIWRPLDDVNGYNIKWIFFFFFLPFRGSSCWLSLSLWVVILLHVDTSHLLVVPRRRECLYTNGMEGRTIFLFFSIQEDPIHRDWLLTTLQLAFFSSSSRSIHLLVFFFFLFLGFLFEHLNLDAGPLLLYTLLLLELFSCCVFCSIGVAKGERERDTGPCHYITWAPYHIQDLSIRICLGFFFFFFSLGGFISKTTNQLSSSLIGMGKFLSGTCVLPLFSKSPGNVWLTLILLFRLLTRKTSFQYAVHSC